MKVKRTVSKKKKVRDFERLERLRINKQIVSNTFLVFHKAGIFSNRMCYKNFFAKELVSYWELYLKEMNIALNNLSPHERKFLEDFFQKRMTYKDMFFSKAAFYRCLGQYSKKFLTLFDFDLFHKQLAEIYNFTSSWDFKDSEFSSFDS